MDHKTFSVKITNLDGEGRTVEGYANVFGNVDAVGDIVHPGAFAKTLNERGGKVKFCWQHDLAEPIGKMIEMQEDHHGLFFKALISDTARGRDALALLKDGAVDSFSIGYDSIKGATDYTKDPTTGATIRNLREVKLYEVSLVTLAANELATVTALKEQPTEAKPYGAVLEGDVWRVYKLDDEGDPTGDPLGEHGTEEEAQAQVRALYASENDKSGTQPTGRKAGRVLSRRNADRIMSAMDLLKEALEEAGLMGMEDEEEMEPEGDMNKAGPGGTPPPTLLSECDRQLKLIEIELEAIDLWR
jgi:HK97 family phage prohead protease